MNVYFCRRDVPCTNTAKVANFGADKAQPDFIPQREALATVLHYTLVLIFPTIILCARRRARKNGGAFRRLITSEKKDILHFTATYWCNACACVFMDIYIYIISFFLVLIFYFFLIFHSHERRVEFRQGTIVLNG